ncbi:ISAs1 family transposase [Thiorhodospira sibirica]|uniref:ISAs1 family transposase n=1 Tax=Thiorhodospira sibirica TaxID=154347 RepID=UPI001FEB5688|nr:ISAs1 family transposase [Thiorhodospira sibirica]
MYPLMEILLRVICATLSGAQGWEAMEDFGKAKLDGLRKFAPFANGILSHDRIAPVMSRLNPKAFQQVFLTWTQAVTEATEGDVIAVDGKTAHGSRDRRKGKAALHRVSAWSHRNRWVLGQEATEEKSNEITAIPKLLELLALKGCIVTLDAMGCQTKIAEQIIDQGGDDVLGLKGNQSTLHEEVKDFFETARAGEFAHVPHDFIEEIDKDHGRLEVRRYWITEELGTLSQTERWKGLRSIGRVERECWIEERHSIERRFFITSIPAQAERFAHAVRGHWGVENLLHWRLDVVFREDATRIRKGNAPAILTSIRHLCMNLLERDPSTLRMSKKRRKANWDDDYRAKVLFG